MIVEATDVSGNGSLANRERRLVYVNTDHVGYSGKGHIPRNDGKHSFDLVTIVQIDGTFFDFLEEPEHFLSDLNAVRPSPLKGTPR